MKHGINEMCACEGYALTSPHTNPLARRVSAASTFRRETGDWAALGKGIVLSALGEPKSGTTWLGTTIAVLATRLCGNSLNQW